MRRISSPDGGLPTAEDLRLSLDGVQAPIDSIAALVAGTGEDSLWDLLIYVDAALSTADGIDRSGKLLAAHADRLTDLGSVSVVVADPDPELLLEATRDEERIAQVLRRLTSEVVGTDRLAAPRERSASALRAIAGEEEAAARSAIRRERGLIERQLEALLEWLSVAPSGRPRLLLLLVDPPAPEAAEYYGGLLGRSDLARDPELSGATADRRLAQLLAAEGWAVFPVLAGAAGTGAGLSLLAEETGGAVLTDAAETLASLDSVLESVRIRYPVPVGLGTFAALDIRTRTPGLRLRYPAWTAVATPLEVSAARARRTLATETPGGALALTAAIVLSEDTELGEVSEPDPEADLPAVRLESLVLFPGRSPGPADSRFRITVVTRRLDEPPSVEHHEVAAGDLSGSSGWIDRRDFAFDEDLQGVAVVVEELRTGAWGGDLAFFSETPLRRPDLRLATAPATTPQPTASPPAPAPPSGATSAAAPERADPGDEAIVIRLLPPRRTSLTGKTRFLTLATSPRIDRVVFSLDGIESGIDDDPPFAATLDLGSPAEPHIVSAVALSASGRRLAEDSLTVNQTGALFTVTITDVDVDTAQGTYAVAAEIEVPPADSLDRVEFYWNETLQTTVTKPPYAARFTAPAATPQDYLRVVAHLAGGDSLEDVRLLAEGPVEEVDVNLVELYVVVSDHNGVPVDDLVQEQFTIRQGSQARQIERFDKATNVPLVMGLVIDTSSSMWSLMPDTKMAAAQFLGNTLTQGDQAFLIDFSTRPRLAHPPTGDLLSLIRAFSSLQPSGFTALYDAIVFTMLQFEEGRGRKALVLLTDGDDYNSRFGPKRCIEYGRRLGVPVYIVAMGGIEGAQRGYRRADLENITERTGGRVFYISSMTELPAAYAQINAELRNQYLLAFSTEDPLDLEELQKLSVGIDDPALSTRTVVGGQQIY